VCVLLGSAVTK